MDQEYFGAEAVTEEDLRYVGSRFSEVRDALFANPYQKVWGRDGQPALPIYKVTLPSVLRGLLSLQKHYLFREATERVVDSHSDLRWGARTGRVFGGCFIRMACVLPASGKSRRRQAIPAISVREARR